MTLSNLSIASRDIYGDELPILPLGSDSKVKVIGTAGSATISYDYGRDIGSEIKIQVVGECY
jgi:hypothetical protein